MGGDNLKPLTLAEMMEEEERKANEAAGSNWRLSMEKNKRELDFFPNTLNIRKNGIETYKDYSKLVEENEKGQEEELSNTSDDDDNDSSTEDEDDTDIRRPSNS